MDLTQLKSRRRWNSITDRSMFTIIWWKITGGMGRIFVEFLTDEPNIDRKAQAKLFKESLKGYGQALQEREMTVEEIEGELNESKTLPKVQHATSKKENTSERVLQEMPKANTLRKHELQLTAGLFINGVQELPWMCTRCQKKFQRHTNAETCKG